MKQEDVDGRDNPVHDGVARRSNPGQVTAKRLLILSLRVRTAGIAGFSYRTWSESIKVRAAAAETAFHGGNLP